MSGCSVAFAQKGYIVMDSKYVTAPTAQELRFTFSGHNTNIHNIFASRNKFDPKPSVVVAVVMGQPTPYLPDSF